MKKKEVIIIKKEFFGLNDDTEADMSCGILDEFLLKVLLIYGPHAGHFC